MRVLKWFGIVIGGLVVLLIIAGSVMYFIGSSRLETRYQVTTAHLTIPSDSASIAHGEHLTHTQGCRDCHTPSLGGQVMMDAPPFRVVASNLTSGEGGIGDTYTDEDWDRAIRHGVRPDGSPLLIMPSAAFHRLSDFDAAALIAYLQTVPPTDNELPPTEVRLPGKIMAAGMLDPAFEVSTSRPPVETPPAPGPTAEYGAYLTSITCAYCHGADLGGAQPAMPGSPPAPDLATAGGWSIADFKHALRTGERPDGTEVDDEFMPIAFTQTMKDHELEAIHAYLATLGQDASR